MMRSLRHTVCVRFGTTAANKRFMLNQKLERYEDLHAYHRKKRCFG